MKAPRSPLARWFLSLVLILCTLVSSGCYYELQNEVISTSMAEYVSGLANTYYSENNKTRTVISAVAGCNDYRYQRYYEDKLDSSGYIRAIRLRGDIYIVQLEDDDLGYYVGFYSFNTYDGFQEVIPDAGDEALIRLAAQHGATLGYDELEELILTGSRDNIMSFLRAHASLAFTK